MLACRVDRAREVLCVAKPVQRRDRSLRVSEAFDERTIAANEQTLRCDIDRNGRDADLAKLGLCSAQTSAASDVEASPSDEEGPTVE